MADVIKIKLDNSQNSSSVELLQEVLADLKIDTKYDKSRNTLMFCFESNEIKTFRTRNAGAKRKELKALYSMREIEEMQKRMTAVEIAKEIGISRALYFKKLKEHRKNGYSESDLF